MIINSFNGPHEFLSNFYRHPLPMFDGCTAKTLEHAFQAMKMAQQEDYYKILSCETPGQAKRLARKLQMRQDWEEVKSAVMLSLLRKKFKAGPLKDMLLATGDAELVEGNTWGDKFWGVCEGEGKNVLGRLLMVVREEVK